METITVLEAFTCLLLGWASACDLRTRRIPNACSVGGAALAAAASAGSGAPPLPLLAAVAATGAFFGAAWLLRPGGLGAGDAKLAVLIAAALGPAALPAFLLGLLAATGWCLAAWALQERRRLSGITVPLAPFLAGGAAATLALAG